MIKVQFAKITSLFILLFFQQLICSLSGWPRRKGLIVMEPAENQEGKAK